MTNMRLNNAVEEALGQGEDCRDGSCRNVVATSLIPAIASGAGANVPRLAALRINHAEDEHYGRRHHD